MADCRHSLPAPFGSQKWTGLVRRKTALKYHRTVSQDIDKEQTTISINNKYHEKKWWVGKTVSLCRNENVPMSYYLHAWQPLLIWCHLKAVGPVHTVANPGLWPPLPLWLGILNHNSFSAETSGYPPYGTEQGKGGGGNRECPQSPLLQPSYTKHPLSL